MGNYRCATMDSLRVILLLLGLCTTAQADGHGVFCTTQFNFWFANNASAESVLLALAEPYNACLTACNMQTNANAKYYQYKELGGLGYPNAGGFDHTCTTPDSSAGNAVPAGGCAFSYPVVANSTCRLKIFGADDTKELQWCMTSLTNTMRVGAADNRRHEDDELLSCPEHTAFDITGSTDETNTYELKAVLFDKFANTLVSICDGSSSSSSSGCSDKFSNAEKSGIGIAAVAGVLLVAGIAGFVSNRLFGT